ncbi:hypothetical protein RB195_022284 [Necator americanus]|uniref:Uncharacterized protein n=1 Tax=Necator americanus TaxID=51031 RepID=A0ABR1EEY3_NECAM
MRKQEPLADSGTQSGQMEELLALVLSVRRSTGVKVIKEQFGSTSPGCAFVRLRALRGRKLWIISAVHLRKPLRTPSMMNPMR